METQRHHLLEGGDAYLRQLVESVEELKAELESERKARADAESRLAASRGALGDAQRALADAEAQLRFGSPCPYTRRLL